MTKFGTRQGREMRLSAEAVTHGVDARRLAGAYLMDAPARADHRSALPPASVNGIAYPHAPLKIR